MTGANLICPLKQSPESSMTASVQSQLIDQARALAEDMMELHEVSFRMGAGCAKPEDYRTGQRIIAEADALARTLDAMAKVSK